MTAVQDAIDAAARHGRLLKVGDVADRLQVSRSKVWEYLGRGELGSLKIDGARRITEEQLADFIAARQA